MTAAEVK